MGVAAWPSSKPDLLNVALTPAKLRFFILGDRDIWGRMNCFDKAIYKGELPVRSDEQFLPAIKVSKTHGQIGNANLLAAIARAAEGLPFLSSVLGTVNYLIPMILSQVTCRLPPSDISNFGAQGLITLKL